MKFIDQYNIMTSVVLLALICWAIGQTIQTRELHQKAHLADRDISSVNGKTQDLEKHFLALQDQMITNLQSQCAFYTNTIVPMQSAIKTHEWALEISGKAITKILQDKLNKINE